LISSVRTPSSASRPATPRPVAGSSSWFGDPYQRRDARRWARASTSRLAGVRGWTPTTSSMGISAYACRPGRRRYRCGAQGARGRPSNAARAWPGPPTTGCTRLGRWPWCAECVAASWPGSSGPR
jgi:hypothetical protein